MKRAVLLSVLMMSGLVLSSGCATMQTWPNYERSAENKMVVIQENIGDGLKTGALTPDQAQVFLATLKSIRTDYEALRNKSVYREEWDNLHRRLDVLGDDVRKAQTTQPTRLDDPRNGEKIVALQGKIDDGRINRRWSSADEREFQSRLDSIRREYLRVTEGGRSSTYEERDDIARRLDVLEADLSRSR
jgi:hypothetical protein